ncbi:MAG: DUF4956 domain-containing protein [Lachnospiraceae bacterium]|nr:DUF4956 domain-containing protein [Lachnospiraceae bacterium]
MKELLYNNLVSTQGALTLEDVIINFLAACVISILIYISYKLSHTGAVYSQKFNVSLVMLVLVTTLVMNVIGNNIALSLGMVGALSIVRFRTAIKDPRDTAYIFWAIAVGICCGVSDYLIAGIGTFIIFLFLTFFGFVRDNERILIVVRMEDKAMEAVNNSISSLFEGKAVLRVNNHSVEEKSAEMIFEISDKLVKKSEKTNGMCNKVISEIEGVKSVSIVRQDDEINQ